MTDTVVIAGAGHAAGQVVATLKQHHFAGKIVLVGEEAYLPYQRPPLSKKFLAGKLDTERLHFKPQSFYDDPDIEVMLNTRVTALSPATRAISIQNEVEIPYSKLVLALGSRVRRVSVPGESLPGVYYLRNIADVKEIRREMAAARKVVIVGAGYIGLEVAAVCRQCGLEVTVVEMAERVMSRVVSPQVSAFFQGQHEDHGVKFLLSTALKALLGDRHVEAVEIDSGRQLEADFVIIGAGIVPNVGLAKTAGLETGDGVVVDDRCQTSDSDIFAVGDCTMHPSSIYDRRIRLESVHNALEQAKTAASNICGIESRYSQVPWFWSDQYDLKLQISGLSQGYDHVVMRGSESDRKFACFYLRNDRLIAVDAVNSPREFMRSKALIANKAVVDTGLLADPDAELTA